MLPLLTIISDFIGLIGGYFIASTMLGLTFSEYWTTAWQALEYNDIAQGLLKPFVFADHHCPGGMLLRHAHHRRHPGRGTGHHQRRG